MKQARFAGKPFSQGLFGMAAALGAMACGGYVYASAVEPAWIDTKVIPFRLPRLDPAFDGYRMAQISDIHADALMTRRLCRIVDQVNAQQPDLIALTGDFVTYRVKYDADELIDCLSKLHARDGVVAVLGNHDHKPNAKAVRHILRACNILELPNAVCTLRRNGAVLHIAGVDDVAARKARLDLVLAQLPDDGAAILLAHEPDFADVSAATGRFDLQLSGHAHGGQVDVPILKTFALPFHGRRYVKGWYQVAGMALYVNRGVGMVPPLLRFNSRPEIGVFDLQAGAA